MSPTEDFLSHSLRHRKSKVDSELQLLHTDHRKTAKHRWSNCFSYILKRCKIKSDTTSSSSTTTSMTLAVPCNMFETNHIKTGHGYPISEKPTLRTIYSSSSLPPPTPVSSPLSPPPRHIMTSRQQQYGTKNVSLTTKPTITRTLPSHHHHQRRYPYRPHVLRLSLNMDQRYSYASSTDSSDTVQNIDDHDDPITSTGDLELTSRRQFNNSSNSNNHRWTMDSFSQPIGLMLRDDSYDGGGGSNSGDFIPSYCHQHQQISQDKEHYDAVVAASKIQHRHRPTSSFCEHDDNDNGMMKDQPWNATTAPPCPRLAL